MSLVARKPVLGISDLVRVADTNHALQPQKMAKGVIFWNWKRKRFYYLGSKNQGADQPAL